MDIAYLKSLESLWLNLASTKRFLKYVSPMDLTVFQRRLKGEGVTFLTNTLPNLGKSIDLYHSTGEWETPVGFKSEGGIPFFLRKAIVGSLEQDVLAVDCVRQLSFLFYKLEIGYTAGQVKEFLDQFVKIDKELPTHVELKDNPLILQARHLIARVLNNEDPYDIRPNHGPGVTSCRTKNAEKWLKPRYSSELDAVYPYSEYFFYSSSHLADELSELMDAEELIPEARVCLVPKDSRGPRVISCEPAEFVYIQQGIMRKLYGILESNDLTSGRINFTDQSINQDAARQGSIDGLSATLDLKDASDRVSWALVQLLFPPNWVRCLEACRSIRTKLPDGRVVELQKFAPMGSSCCFPVEAMVFWAIASAATRGLDTLVYGDDLITSVINAPVVMEGLESVGLKVNRSKSFTKGPFRESCGGDYYNGVDVTPVRLRKVFGKSHVERVTAIELAGELLAKFGEDAISCLDLIESIYGPVPRTELNLPGCVNRKWSASNDVFFKRRYNKHLQRFEHRISQISVRPVKVRENTWCELLRKELSRDTASHPFGDYRFRWSNPAESMEPGTYVVPYSTHVKWGWVWLGSPDPSS